MILDIDDGRPVWQVLSSRSRILLRIWLLLCISYGIRRMMKCIILPSSKDRRAKENVLCGFGENGKREELQTAPAAGSEISAVLDLVREKEEA